MFRKIIAVALTGLTAAVLMQGASAETVYTNKDIEQMKKAVRNAPSYKPPKKKDEEKKETPAVKKEINLKQRSPKNDDVIRYEEKDGIFNLTVRSAPKPKPKTAQEEPQQDFSLPSYLTVTEQLLPYDKWEEEYEEYFDIHYGELSADLEKPTSIVIRSSRAGAFSEIWTIYTMGSLYHEGDDGPMYGHLSSHYIVDGNGSIFQTMPLWKKTRGAPGMEHKALIIDLTAYAPADFMVNSVQRKSLTELTAALCEKFNIPAEKIYSLLDVARGKTAVPEYLDLGDSDYPDRYSPHKFVFGPGNDYMNLLRSGVKEEAARNQTRKNIRK